MKNNDKETIISLQKQLKDYKNLFYYHKEALAILSLIFLNDETGEITEEIKNKWIGINPALDKAIQLIQESHFWVVCSQNGNINLLLEKWSKI